MRTPRNNHGRAVGRVQARDRGHDDKHHGKSAKSQTSSTREAPSSNWKDVVADRFRRFGCAAVRRHGKGGQNGVSAVPEAGAPTPGGAEKGSKNEAKRGKPLINNMLRELPCLDFGSLSLLSASHLVRTPSRFDSASNLERCEADGRDKIPTDPTSQAATKLQMPKPAGICRRDARATYSVIATVLYRLVPACTAFANIGSYAWRRLSPPSAAWHRLAARDGTAKGAS
jgi:hypothetical protein